MADVVVDTDIVSYLFKRDTRAALYRPYLTGERSIISFMTVAELEYWTLARNWGPSRRADLERFLKENFVVRPYSWALCRKWAEVSDGVRRRGRVIAQADAWHAATALLHNIPLVTHNVRDFRAVAGLTIITVSAS